MHRFGEEYYQFFIEKTKPLVSEGSLINENGRYYIPENHIMISDNITCDLLWDDYCCGTIVIRGDMARG